jgi:hypothetical protein
MKKIFLLAIVFCSFHSFSQERTNQCGFIIPDKLLIPPSRFVDVYEARDYIQRMLDTIEWKENFSIREENGMNNAYATIINGRRWIIYDNDFLEKLDFVAASKWASISVLAHELGHHYRNHVVDGRGSTPPKELEADFISGYIMARFGATLEEAKVAMQKIATEQGSSSHPPKQERLSAIAQGWNYAKGLSTNPANPTGPGNPKPQTGTGNTKPQPKPGQTPTAPPTTNPQTDLSWIYLQHYGEQAMVVYLSDDRRNYQPVELKPGAPFIFKFEIYQYGFMKLINTPGARVYRLSHFKDYSIVWSRRNRNWMLVEIP